MKEKMRLCLWLWLWGGLFLAPSPVWAGPGEILFLKALGTLNARGILHVEETMEVQAPGGTPLVRHVPLVYQPPGGAFLRGYPKNIHAFVDGKPLYCAMEGYPMGGNRKVSWKSPWVVGVALRLGDPYKGFPRGKHTVKLEYDLQGVVAEKESKPTLFWGVTGPQRPFTPLEAEYSLRFPQGDPGERVRLLKGSRGYEDESFRITPQNSVVIERPLPQAQELVLAWEIPPGMLDEVFGVVQSPGDPPSGEEKILSYTAQALVDDHARLQVKEEVLFNLWGELRRHGIFRESPAVEVRDHKGWHTFSLQVLTARMDGREIPFETRSQGATSQLYVGDPYVPMTLGKHKLSLLFQSSDPLPFGSPESLLRWPVTGRGWGLPIEKVLFSLKFPHHQEVSLQKVVRERGATSEDVLSLVPLSSDSWETLQILGVGEGLTLLSPCFQSGDFREDASSQAGKILFWDTQASLSSDTTLHVVEHIRFNVPQGLSRKEFPRDFRGLFKPVPHGRGAVVLNVEEVRLDGAEVPWKSGFVSPGVFRITLGDALDTTGFLFAPGEHQCTLTYTLTGKVGFTRKYHELTWTVTGVGEPLSVEEARFSLALPRKGHFLSVGSAIVQGDVGQNPSFRLLSQDVAVVENLAPSETLVVRCTWPGGLLTLPPRDFSFRGCILRILATLPLMLYMMVPLGLGAIFFLLWCWGGKDPVAPPVETRFGPPSQVSPGFLRYLRNMRFDGTSFAADVLGLGAKGYLVIRGLSRDEWQNRIYERWTWAEDLPGEVTRESPSAYLLVRTRKEGVEVLTELERILLEKLFPQGKTTFLVEYHGSSELRSVQKTLARAYKEKNKEEKFFRKHQELWILGTTSLIPLLLLVGDVNGMVPFKTSFLLQEPWQGVLFFSGALILGVWGKAVQEHFFPGTSMVTHRGLVEGLPSWVWISALVALGLGVLGQVLGMSVLMLLGSFGSTSFIIALFKDLLMVRSARGSALSAHIKGLVPYLKDSRRTRFGPSEVPREESLQTFETLLPYALALDVEEPWAHRFDSLLQEQGQEISWLQGEKREFLNRPLGILSVIHAVEACFESA